MSRKSLRVSQKTGGGGEHTITQSPYSGSNALWKYLVVLLVSVWDTEVSTFTLEGGGAETDSRQWAFIRSYELLLRHEFCHDP